MLKRKIYDELLNWKNTKSKECLLVTGARQIGKTYIIENFGKNEYSSYIYINFYEHPEYKNIFADSLQAKEIYKRISLYLEKVNFVSKDTLIFLDEIQECPNARTALKFLAIDNEYDVIASGSLLGLNYRGISSIPVGYERKIEMYSLDFEEFLWAMGKNEESIKTLKEYFDKKKIINEDIHNLYMKLLREYLVVGGMPEIVNKFIETSNYQEVYKTQKKILDDYNDDIKHYASKNSRIKIQECYNSIPRQLAKDYTKFQYKIVDKNGSSRKYENALEWLNDAGLIKFCKNVSTPETPLIAYEKSSEFKVYFTDIGLLTCQFGLDTQISLIEDTLKGSAKGGIYENLVFDILTKKGYTLYYFKNENNTQEIEFLLVKDNSVVPIEVKSKNGSTISLNNYITEYKPKKAYKLISGNIGVSGTKISLPLYMTMFL